MGNIKNTEQRKVENLLDFEEDITKIVLKFLYNEKSVNSLKALTAKVLESVIKERITISEKITAL